jgi:hypothetical protein
MEPKNTSMRDRRGFIKNAVEMEVEKFNAAGGWGDAIPLIKFFEMPRPVGGVIHSMDSRRHGNDNILREQPS